MKSTTTSYRGRGQLKLKLKEQARLDQADLRKRVRRLKRRGYHSLSDPIPKKKGKYRRLEDDEAHDSFAANDGQPTTADENPIEF